MVRVADHPTWLFGGVHQMTIFLKVGTQSTFIEWKVKYSQSIYQRKPRQSISFLGTKMLKKVGLVWRPLNERKKALPTLPPRQLCEGAVGNAFTVVPQPAATPGSIPEITHRPGTVGSFPSGGVDGRDVRLS